MLHSGVQEETGNASSFQWIYRPGKQSRPRFKLQLEKGITPNREHQLTPSSLRQIKLGVELQQAAIANEISAGVCLLAAHQISRAGIPRARLCLALV